MVSGLKEEGRREGRRGGGEEGRRGGGEEGGEEGRREGRREGRGGGGEEEGRVACDSTSRETNSDWRLRVYLRNKSRNAEREREGGRE